MRLRTAVCVLVPALAMMGCASQKPVEPPASPIDPRLDELRRSQVALSAAQQTLEARLARLEDDRAGHASRLAQFARSHDELKQHTDGVRAQSTATQSGLSALSATIEQQAVLLNQLRQSAEALTRQTDTLHTRSVETQAGLSALSGRVEQQAAGLAQAKETADDAVKIARDSRVVAGKVVDTLTLTQDKVLYSYEQPELTSKGREALDGLIGSVRPLMPHAFIEIIGFSDDYSLGSQNRRIALERAESVRRYLHEVGGIPLHRMSTISYGDLKPLADNASMEGRIQNRRVVIQVLK